MPSAHIGDLNIWDIEEHAMVSVSLMDKAQLKQLVELGMEVGSHGEKHLRLDSISNKLAFDDVLNSKKTLEKLLNNKIYSFAYPYGKVPAQHKSMLRKAGYAFGLSIYTPFETDFTLRRFAINEKDSKNDIDLKLSRKYRIMRFFYDPVLLLKNKLFKV